MRRNRFFNESKEQSSIKTSIVTKYFITWAKVMRATIERYPSKGSGRIAYIDLFAGPGRYKDGTISTPINVLKMAIEDDWLSQSLVTMFNDKDEEYVRTLDNAINSLPGISKLRHKPQIFNDEVGTRIVRMFEEMHLVPTLFFVDPWGYKGLSLRLINSVLKDWGCDCIFFFNYNRIYMGLYNELVREHMEALFGDEGANHVRRKLEQLNNPIDKEYTIVEALTVEIQKTGLKFVIPFRFKDEHGTRTSHHLFFVSKNIRGYEIMKNIMARISSTKEQGVPTFEYNPVSSNYPLLFEFNRPLDELKEMLLEEFAGQTLKVQGIYNKHHVGRRYIKQNYKDVLVQLENEGKIISEPSSDKRRKMKGKPTMADHVEIVFPKE